MVAMVTAAAVLVLVGALRRVAVVAALAGKDLGKGAGRLAEQGAAPRVALAAQQLLLGEHVVLAVLERLGRHVAVHEEVVVELQGPLCVLLGGEVAADLACRVLERVRYHQVTLNNSWRVGEFVPMIYIYRKTCTLASLFLYYYYKYKYPSCIIYV